MLELVPIPFFQDGQPLGASDLNRLGAMQELLHQRNQRPNPGVLMTDMVGADTLWFYHHFRYLHYNLYIPSFGTTGRVWATLSIEDEDNIMRPILSFVQDDNPAEMTLFGAPHAAGWVNGSTFTPGWVSGYVDLQYGTDTLGVALRIPWYRGVKLVWTLDDTGSGQNASFYVARIWESWSTAGRVGVDYTHVTFGAGFNGGKLSADGLNRISHNLRAMIDRGGHWSQHGHTVADVGANESPSMANDLLGYAYYRMMHAHRYLYVRAAFDVGFTGASYRFRVAVRYRTVAGDGPFTLTAQVYNTTFTRGDVASANTSDYHDGYNMRHFHVFCDLSSLNIPADWSYMVTVGAGRTHPDDAGIRILMVAEVPTTTAPQG